MDLSDDSRSLSIFNYYFDAFCINAGAILNGKKIDHDRFMKDLGDIFEKYYLIIQRIP